MDSHEDKGVESSFQYYLVLLKEMAKGNGKDTTSCFNTT